MPTETQHLEQRVAALQSDLNARDQDLDDAATENNERELSRRSWFDEAQRLEKECERLRLERRRMDVALVACANERDELRAKLETARAALRTEVETGDSWRKEALGHQDQLAERDALMKLQSQLQGKKFR